MLRLSHGRSLIRVAGRDARQMLQGMCTNDVRLLSRQSILAAGFLNARGRLIADALLHSDNEEEVILELDNDANERLRSHLIAHKLRAKVTIEPALDLTPAASSAVFATAVGENATRDPRSPPEAPFCLPSLYRGVVREPTQSPQPDEPPPPEWLLYTLHRMLNGLAEGARDIPNGSAMPLESNFDFCAGVSFNKGCYVGQELTARTHHRGVTRKRLLPVSIGGPIDDTEHVWATAVKTNAAGLSVQHFEEDDDDSLLVSRSDTAKRTGSLRSVVNGLGDGVSVGIALVRLENCVWEEPCFRTADGRDAWPLIPPWWPETPEADED